MRLRAFAGVLLIGSVSLVRAEHRDRDLAGTPLDPNAPSVRDVAPAFMLSTSPSTRGNRYGLFNGLDRRSIYGQYWYPEPLATDEADVDNEIRFNWFHMENSHRQFDGVATEFEHAFGLLTVEIEGGYENDRSAEFNADTGSFDHEREEGFTNIELAARYPFFEYVSDDGSFDDAVVFGLEIAPPTRTRISHDTEIVPKVFNLMRFGKHFSVQTGLGLSTLVGPEDRGLSVIEYDAVFGYELTHDDLPLPGVSEVVPLLEFEGEYALNHEDAGTNELFGTVGFRFIMKFSDLLHSQPRIGLGYTFPVDAGARREFDWGVVTSVIFEY